MEYDVVIGIENHIELNTKTKMFSGAPFEFGKEANTGVNEIDLAMPGTLPSVNKEAVKKALLVCLGLNFEIDPLIKFDRKNYFYSDLPKGYQITQQYHPIGRNGHLTIDGGKRINIERVHMEEDTAKQFHLKNETLIDFNRAGAPLIEIVSKPEMVSGEEAAGYVEKLRQILLYLDVSDCKMEAGSMRCDVNVSIMPKGSTVFGTKVEIKNLNSINNVKLAIDYEINRQKELLEGGQEVIQETRRFDEKTGTTVLMRKKEGAIDYRYFPDANITPILIDGAYIEKLKSEMIELPDAKAKRYQDDYGLSDYDVSLLINNKDLAMYFEAVMQIGKNPKLTCNMLNSELLGLMAKNEIGFADLEFKAAEFAKLINHLDAGNISSKQAKTILTEALYGKEVDAIIEEKGFKQVSDIGAIQKMVDEVLDENPQSIVDFKNGKDRALGYLVGQLMKKSKGQANPALASKLVKEALEQR